MPQLNFSPEEIFKIIQNLQPAFFYKGVLLLLLIGYLIFHLVVLNQIRSMDKVVSQPSSSAILGLISILFITSGIGLFIFIYTTTI